MSQEWLPGNQRTIKLYKTIFVSYSRYLSESTHSPSPDEIKRWLQTNAGENFVQLPTISNTKNLLLHMNCYGNCTVSILIFITEATVG